MEDQVYETEDNLTLKEVRAFEKWLDKEVGTEYERNESGSGEPDEYYLIIFDLTHGEVIMIREHEVKMERLRC